MVSTEKLLFLSITLGALSMLLWGFLLGAGLLTTLIFTILGALGGFFSSVTAQTIHRFLLIKEGRENDLD